MDEGSTASQRDHFEREKKEEILLPEKHRNYRVHLRKLQKKNPLPNSRPKQSYRVKIQLRILGERRGEVIHITSRIGRKFLWIQSTKNSEKTTE